MDLSINKRDLITAINSSFPIEPIPAKIAGRDGDFYVQDEYSYVATYFKGRKWTDVTCDGLWNDYPGPPDACLAFMSPEGCVYYLPAFLMILINNYKEADVVADTAINFIIPNDAEYFLEWQTERYKLLSYPQREVLTKFLSFVANSHPDDYDLQQLESAYEYWNKYS